MIIKEYQEIDDIKIFDKDILEDHRDYNANGLDNLYKAENNHFWFITRKEFILQNFKKYIPKDKKIIEIGAGTGNVSRYLKEHTYNKISVGEMHLNGLKYAQSYGIEEYYQFDLLDSPFQNEFDVVCLFDVLEHIEDDNLALSNIYQMLKPRGEIILTVPSHQWLWNRDDAIAGHKIRYTKKELVERLEANGFEIVTKRYFFISILPLLYLRTVLNRDNGSKVKEEEYKQDITINKSINMMLLFLSRIENKINRFLPNLIGGSLFIIARKV
jgi:2-polyprenyl-3-methyl-5-hydroxy-6-metoxy-1,4-benzoquinol methylase